MSGERQPMGKYECIAVCTFFICVATAICCFFYFM